MKLNWIEKPISSGWYLVRDKNDNNPRCKMESVYVVIRQDTVNNCTTDPYFKAYRKLGYYKSDLENEVKHADHNFPEYALIMKDNHMEPL